ncbi:MAG: helix-turn-helix domain-containing protein [Clostridiales bacterium]|nr:helix-turn-helix domain-containing protein [Clostridiales bacterium]
MSRYDNFKEEMLANPEVKEAYDALEPEFDIIQAMIDARKELHLTQKELSARTGITQADISHIENGTRNPSLEMLKRLAKGMGMRLKLEFIPENSSSDRA